MTLSLCLLTTYDGKGYLKPEKGCLDDKNLIFIDYVRE